tara:strand:- start:915 stop:1625 length:711 start_codon:yes stop_codon:yes gene_type:complete
MESYKVITRNKDIGSNKNLLDKGLIPGIIYGKGTEPKKIAFDNKALQKLMHSKGFYTKILNIEVDGKKEKVLPKALQYHPVTDKLIHLDLLKIQENTKVTVEVPVEFLNQDVCPGLKKGGVLNIVRRTIELICNAGSIPEILEFDIAETDIGDSLKISNINLPEGVQTTIRDRDFVIATIVSPTIEVEETKTEEESAEGETGEATGEATGEEKTEEKKEEADTSKEIKSEKEEDKK